MELAFTAGYDPALELANRAPRPLEVPRARSPSTETEELDADGHLHLQLRRDEQDTLDRIVQGREAGRYFMLLGPKVRFSMYSPLTQSLIFMSSVHTGHRQNDDAPRLDARDTRGGRERMRCTPRP